MNAPVDQKEDRQQLAQAIRDDDDEAAENAVYGLLPEDEPWLLDMAASADPNRRWWAVRALAFCGSAACVPAVSAALGDADSSVRAVGVLALAHLHARVPEAIQPLLPSMAALLADEDGSTRQIATDALAMCGDDAVDALADVLDGGPESARSRATTALRKIGTMKAAGILFRYLNDPNYLVSSYAYEALDEMGLLETTLLIL